MSRRILVATLAITLWSMLSFHATAHRLDRVVIVDATFTVEDGKFRHWEFQVGSNGANISGEFRATGGSAGDKSIDCLILDRDNFENYRKGRALLVKGVYYDSGNVTEANINAKLGEGDYVIFFRNRSKFFTEKTVTARVERQR